MASWVLILLSVFGSLLTGGLLGWIFRCIYARFQLTSSEQKAERIIIEAEKKAEAAKKEYLLEAKEQLIRERHQHEKEFRERRIETQNVEKRLVQKEENLEQKLGLLDQKTQDLEKKREGLVRKEAEAKELELKLRSELENIASLSCEEAKRQIMQSLENEARHDAQALLNKIEHEAKITADKKARDILVSSIQSIATDVTAEACVTSVTLPSDDMKGRIIGREGRNIRALETETGVDIIIDDTPEAVVISCFDPERKEIAKRSLEKLIQDGRIHPARIEEVVRKVEREVKSIEREEAEKALFDLGIHNLSHEAIQQFGRLYFRTSYGQNVLFHSKEVARLCGHLAAEVGADREKAKRAGLFHDIGKGMEKDGDKNHAELSAEFAKRIGEDEIIINAVAAHHNDVEPKSIEAVIVQIADAISAARPGARHDNLDNYIKRLQSLEDISKGFEGVEKAFAIQAGRELRILVEEKVSDEKVDFLARDIAKKIESELKYPGRIKVTVIKEKKCSEYAS